MLGAFSYTTFKKYIICAIVLFITIATYYYLSNELSGYWYSFQVIGVLCSLFCIFIGLNTKKYIPAIIVSQLLLIVLFCLYNNIETPDDYYVYTSSVKSALNEPSFLSSMKKIIDVNANVDNLNDLGYYIPLLFLYRSFSPEAADIWMCVIKFLAHTLTCFMLLSLCDKMKIQGGGLITLLWGCNIYNAYFIIAGLKEPLFVLSIMMAIYSMYLFVIKPTLTRFVLYALLLTATYCFRASFPAYFIVAIVGFFIAKRLSSKMVITVLIAGILLATFGGLLVANYFPMIQGFLIDRENAFDSQGSMYMWLNTINAFISPYPAFSNYNQNVNLATAPYAVFHTSLAIFSIIGILDTIKEKRNLLYPFIFVAFMNSLMLIITGFAMNARYTYPLAFLYYLFIPKGIDVCHRKGYCYLYLFMVIIITILYNNRA